MRLSWPRPARRAADAGGVAQAAGAAGREATRRCGAGSSAAYRGVCACGGRSRGSFEGCAGRGIRLRADAPFVRISVVSGNVAQRQSGRFISARSEVRALSLPPAHLPRTTRRTRRCIGAVSSVVRALASHARGRRFDPSTAHQRAQLTAKGQGGEIAKRRLRLLRHMLVQSLQWRQAGIGQLRPLHPKPL